MTTITLLIILLLCAWTLRPLFSQSEYRPAADQMDAVLHQRQQIQSTLDDLQLDYETGKLSKAEFEELTAEVADRKKEAKPEAVEPVCPGCGNDVGTEDKFCSNCGRKLGFEHE